MTEPAQITIRRTTGYADRLRAYKVKINGEIVGSLRAEESITVPVAPGRHSIEVRIDWCGSKPVSFSAQSDDKIGFECGSNLTGWRVLLALVYIAFMTDQYLWLRRVT